MSAIVIKLQHMRRRSDTLDSGETSMSCYTRHTKMMTTTTTTPSRRYDNDSARTRVTAICAAARPQTSLSSKSSRICVYPSFALACDPHCTLLFGWSARANRSLRQASANGIQNHIINVCSRYCCHHRRRFSFFSPPSSSSSSSSLPLKSRHFARCPRPPAAVAEPHINHINFYASQLNFSRFSPRLAGSECRASD